MQRDELKGPREYVTRLSRLFALSSSILALLAIAYAAPAGASKQVVDYFGSEAGEGTAGGQFMEPYDIAVNSTGAGPANRGDIYVFDTKSGDSFNGTPGKARIQRFAQDDNGTPANRYDDKYSFVSAWGIGVLTGGDDYEICTEAASCNGGIAGAGDGTQGGNGSLETYSRGLAVDQDTGNVYASDSRNNRVNVYDGTGVFLRSFGWDVVSSGPGDNGVGYEVCVAANGDICKKGAGGSGIGQLSDNGGVGIVISPPDGNPASGTVYLADSHNNRVNTYALDGSTPSSFGSAAIFGGGPNDEAPTSIAVDSRGIVYAGDPNSPSEIERYDSANANGGGIGFLSPITTPPILPTGGGDWGSRVLGGLEMDPASDTLYLLRSTEGPIRSFIQQFGPVNAPGAPTPPATYDDIHGDIAQINLADGLGFDAGNGRLFVSSHWNSGGPWDISGKGAKSGIYVIDEAGGAPTATIESVDGITSSSATIHATVDPNGPPMVGYRLEYSLDGSSWKSTPEVEIGTQETPQAIAASLGAGPGLSPETFYHVRLVVKKRFMTEVTTSELTFTTLSSPPHVETVGSPVRTSTSVRFEGRVDPRNTATSYHFEYGSEGPCPDHPCASTPARALPAGDLVRLVAENVGGLLPGTTYHYRVVADNGNPGSPSAGEDMTARTRDSDAPLSHGHFPGPPGSDRAWEQVNSADTGGNPVVLTFSAAFSDDGNRATYGVAGGTPLSDTGSAFNQFFAQRTQTGWETRTIFPARDELAGTNWLPPAGRDDLGQLVAANFNATGGGFATFRISPEGAPVKLFEVPKAEYSGFYTASDDGSRAVMALRGPHDPAHPVPSGRTNVYDVSTGSPQMLGLLPGGGVPACDVKPRENYGLRAEHWLSADGSEMVFSTTGCGARQFYLRDIEGEQTTRISGPPVSGLDCGAQLLKATPGSVFLVTQSRLATEDGSATSCSGGGSNDVYRFDIADRTFQCVTCVVPGLEADVLGSSLSDIAVAEDGSRVYFRSPNRLVSGAAPNGIYRVEVGSGDLAYVGFAGNSGSVGEEAGATQAINRDASVIVFGSSDPSLNPLGGTDNGGTLQYYRYDDRDRSLICVSCPQDGSEPAHAAPTRLGPDAVEPVGPNVSPLSDDGVFVFRTTEPLLGADQNTARPGQDPNTGMDVYEWRDGRPLLITDGLKNWPGINQTPVAASISPSGRDVFFLAAAQYTPDALDDYSRLYDARIGGGFDFPVPPKPCPLEVCQGTPKGGPEEAMPGTSAFSGPGNSSMAPARPRCSKPKRKVRRAGKVRCVKPRKKTKAKAKKANSDRRAAR